MDALKAPSTRRRPKGYSTARPVIDPARMRRQGEASRPPGQGETCRLNRSENRNGGRTIHRQRH